MVEDADDGLELGDAPNVEGLVALDLRLGVAAQLLQPDGEHARDDGLGKGRADVRHDPVELGNNSIRKCWLGFWIEKSPKLWLVIPNTKRMFNKREILSVNCGTQ